MQAFWDKVTEKSQTTTTSQPNLNLKQEGEIRTAAKKLTEDVEALRKKTEEDIKKNPKEAVTLLKTAKSDLDELSKKFTDKYPDSDMYPGDAIQKGHQHFDKISDLVGKKSVEKGDTTGKVAEAKVLQSATELRNWIDTQLKVVPAITSEKLQKAKIPFEKGIQQLSRIRSDLGVRANNFKKLDGHDKYLAGEWKLEASIKQLDTSIEKHLVPLQNDAHGNVRALAEKEDQLVKDAIKKVPPKALRFQEKKFGERMGKICGQDGATWESLMGTKNNPFDVISQKTLLDDKTAGKPLGQEVMYVDIQNSMYGDEMDSRAKLVRAFYEKKKDEEKKPPLSTAVEEMEKAFTELKEAFEKKDQGLISAATTKKKLAIEKAFAALGMKGVSKEVEHKRDEIKGRLFLAKNDPKITRGRVFRTPADGVLGFAEKAQQKLDQQQNKEKAEAFRKCVAELKDLREKLLTASRATTGFLDGPPWERAKKNDPSFVSTYTEGEMKKWNEDKVKALNDEKKAKEPVEAKAKEALELMKGLDIGLNEKGEEIGRGIGSDDLTGTRDVRTSEIDIAMGKNINVRDDESAASAIFRELGIPFTGGASGSTVDAVGGIVDTLLLGEDVNKEFPEDDERLLSAEQETCMYIMGMHNAGHHSLVEMLFAAKQYPQKLFRNLRDPITDYLAHQKKVEVYLTKHKSTAEIEDKNTPELRRKELAAKRHEDMLKDCPEDIISHDACTKAFMSYCEKVLEKVEA
jgi:hypothetical protein